MGKHRTGDIQQPQHIHRELTLHIVARRRLERPGEGVSGIVDHNIDPAEMIDGLADRGLDARRVEDIETGDDGVVQPV